MTGCVVSAMWRAVASGAVVSRDNVLVSTVAMELVSGAVVLRAGVRGGYM